MLLQSRKLNKVGMPCNFETKLAIIEIPPSFLKFKISKYILFVYFL